MSCACRISDVPSYIGDGTGFRMVLSTIIEEKKPGSETPKPIQVITPKIITPPSNKLILSNNMEFMRIPAGKFLMGSNEGKDEEKPQHTVDIPYDYWMARLPVTNELYNAYAKAKRINHPVFGWETKKYHPVVDVTWYAATDYCKWLNNLLQAELPSGLVFRLPTEAEWEKAARGTDEREYPWGNTFDKNKCNSKEGGKDNITPVGLYSPHGDSPYGCADMCGNVWEWCNDWYDETYYHSSPSSNPSGPDLGTKRVLRGGSWTSHKSDIRSSYRIEFTPVSAISNFGFRVVVSHAINFL